MTTNIMLFLLLALVPVSSFSKGAPKDIPKSKATKSLDLLWKARGLQAEERIKELADKNGKSDDKNLSPDEICERNLEASYIMYASEKSKLVKTEMMGMAAHAFMFLANNAQPDKGLTMIQLLFEPESKEASGFVVQALAKDWSMFALVPHMVMVKGPTCAYTFNLSDPLNCTAKAVGKQ